MIPKVVRCRHVVEVGVLKSLENAAQGVVASSYS